MSDVQNNETLFSELQTSTKWSTGVAFERSNPLPLDRWSVFENKTSALDYLSNPVAYPGQFITYVDNTNNTMVPCIISQNATGDGLDLKEIGQGNGDIVIPEDGDLSEIINLLNNHISDKNNPHVVTPQIIGAVTPEELQEAIDNIEISEGGTGVKLENGSLLFNDIENNFAYATQNSLASGENTYVNVKYFLCKFADNNDKANNVLTLLDSEGNPAILDGWAINDTICIIANNIVINGSNMTITSIVNNKITISTSGANVDKNWFNLAVNTQYKIWNQLKPNAGAILSDKLLTKSIRGAHTEGWKTASLNEASHAEGRLTIASGRNAHAEGAYSRAQGEASHAEGYNTQATGIYSHSEGNITLASGKYTHAEGYGTNAAGFASHAEGNYTTAKHDSSHAEGYQTQTTNAYQHVSGKWSLLENPGSTEYLVVVGNGTNSQRSNAYTLDMSGNGRFAGSVYATGGKLATQEYATNHYITIGSRLDATIGNKATAEGNQTEASGDYSHAEGGSTIAKGSNSHAEGYATEANHWAAHAEGSYAKALHDTSHAEGWHTETTNNFQHVSGKYNLLTNPEGVEYLVIVGNGSGGGRSNAYTLDDKGNAWFAGNIKIGGTGWNDKNATLINIQQLLNQIQALERRIATLEGGGVAAPTYSGDFEIQYNNSL